jgi:diguanylate cyclase (GGDEF)-like protein
MLLEHSMQYLISIVACICFLIFICVGKTVPAEGISKYFVAGTIAILAVIVAEIGESFFASPYYTEPNWQRWVFAISAYILRPGIAFIILAIPIRGEKKSHILLLALPLAVNAAFLLSSPFTGIVFSYDEANKYSGGTLKYLPFVVGGIYLIYFLFFSILRIRTGRASELLVSASTLVMCGLAVFLESEFEVLGSLPAACIINMIFYYVYFYMDYYSKDSLTGAYRRSVLYSDLKRTNAYYVIIFDVNGLKRINDASGHVAGDKAIRNFAGAVISVLPRQASFYRIGGDEFTVLYPKADKSELVDFLKTIEQKVDKALLTYGFSYGFAQLEKTKDFDETYRDADNMLYRNKELFWKNHNSCKS